MNFKLDKNSFEHLTLSEIQAEANFLSRRQLLKD